MKVTSVKIEIPDLNYFKPFEFEPKTNIGDINSSSCGGSAVQKQSLADVLQNRCQACNFITRDSTTGVFQWNLRNFLDRGS